MGQLGLLALSDPVSGVSSISLTGLIRMILHKQELYVEAIILMS